jgi:hypothetical protein
MGKSKSKEYPTEKLTSLEKILLGGALVTNLGTTTMALATNIDEKYLAATVGTSILLSWAGGGSVSYRLCNNLKNEVYN